MKISRVLIIGFLLPMVGLGLASHASEDDRELVKIPPMMQEHMLANMRPASLSRYLSVNAMHSPAGQ
jgi:hypothetical protein